MSRAGLAAYVHLPWCVRKCPYCDFNSHVGETREDDYVTALLRDIAFEATDARGRRLSSIFFGGGTPSLFSAQSIGRILAALEGQLGFRTNIEITLEANPGTADAGNFAGYRAAGVNRLSIGVQSFADDALRRIGRIHDSAEARRAFTLARASGFDNINLDLMYALPQQSADSARQDVEQAIALAPEHVSYYQLTLEPGTAFGNHPPALPQEDTAFEIGECGAALLAQAGYRRYEVSAYAQSGARSRHNLNYWRFGDYLGIGAGAHGKLTLGNGKIRRRAKLRSPERFMKEAGSAAAVAREDWPDARGRRLEYMLNALRLQDGFTLNDYARRCGLKAAELGASLQHSQHLGLITLRRGRVRPTRHGRLFLNDLIEKIGVPD